VFRKEQQQTLKAFDIRRAALIGDGLARSGSELVLINEVNLRRARLVLGWVTVSGFNFRCGIFISICNQPPRSTQPSHSFVGRHNEYQRTSTRAVTNSIVDSRRREMNGHLSDI